MSNDVFNVAILVKITSKFYHREKTYNTLIVLRL